MKVEQMIFTSCEKGLSGYPGLQVQAITPGLAPTDMEELSSTPAYRPPPSLPPQPDAAQIAQHCPPSLYTRTLRSGRLAVTRTMYVGQDYSGRYGNFIAHSLVFDAPPPFHPVELLGWDGWQSVVRSTPPKLVELGAADFVFASPVIEQARQFMRAAPERIPLVATMINAAVIGRDKPASPGLIIVGPAAELPLWVASVALALAPAGASKPFSLCTYVGDAIPFADVRATVADMTGSWLSSGGVLVNVAAGAPAMSAPPFARHLAEMLAESGENAQLGPFAQGFDLIPTAEQLGHVVDWWELARDCAQPRVDRLGVLAKFAAAKLRKNAEATGFLTVAMRRLSRALSTCPGLADATICLSLAAMCIRAADTELTHSVRDFVHRALWISLTAGGPWTSFDVTLGQTLEPDGYLALANSAMQDLANKALRNPATAEAAMQCVSGFLQRGNVDPWKSQPFLAAVLVAVHNAAAVRAKLMALTLSSAGPNAFAAMCLSLSEEEAARATLPAILAQVFEADPLSDAAVRVRSALCKAALADLVEQTISLHVASIAPTRIGDLIDVSAFSDPLRHAIENRWARLSQGDRQSFARCFVLRTELLDQMGPAVACQILRAADATLKCADGGDAALGKALLASKHSAAAGLQRVAMLRLVRGMNRLRDEQSLAGFTEQLEAAGLTDGNRRELVKQAISQAVVQSDSPVAMRAILAFCVRFDAVPVLAKSLVEVMHDAAACRDNVGLSCALSAIWLECRINPRSPWPKDVRRVLARAFPGYLVWLPRKTWRAVQSRVLKMRPADDLSHAFAWKNVIDQVNRRRRSPLHQVAVAVGASARMIGRMFGGGRR